MTVPPSARRASALVAAGILLSRIAGLVRERVLAHYLGVSVAADAFRAALRIPNLMQNLLGEGVLSASFVPVYSSLLEQDRRRAGRVAGAVLSLLTSCVAIITLAGVLLARPIVGVLTPGFSGSRLELTVTLTRVLFLGSGFLVVSAWCVGVLNSHRRFFLSYVAPVAWNIAMIAAVVAVAARGAGVRDLAVAVAWGAAAGAVLQAAVQIPAAVKLGAVRLNIDTGLGEVRSVVRRFGPAVAGRGSVQLGAYIDILLASLLAVGAVTALAFAQVLYTLPISVFGMSVAAAELPELARGGDAAAMRERIVDGLARVSFYVVPCVVAYLVAGDLIVGALLETGRFGADETRLVWLVLMGYSLGLLASTSSRLLQSVLYASGNTRTPAYGSVMRFSGAAVLGLVLMFQLDRLQLTGSGIAGLEGLPASWVPLPEAVRVAGGDLRLGAVGLSVAAGIAAWLEFLYLRRKLMPLVGRVPIGGRQLGRVLIAAIAAGAVALAVRLVVPWSDPLAAVVTVGIPATITYAIACRALAIHEASALAATIRMARRGT